MRQIFMMVMTVSCLSGCEQSASDVGGVSAGEARALNEAAARLDMQMNILTEAQSASDAATVNEGGTASVQ